MKFTIEAAKEAARKVLEIRERAGSEEYTLIETFAKQQADGNLIGEGMIYAFVSTLADQLEEVGNAQQGLDQLVSDFDGIMKDAGPCGDPSCEACASSTSESRQVH